jgi:multisubunit Na+/H+ antiporter MnhF subunit
VWPRSSSESTASEPGERLVALQSLSVTFTVVLVLLGVGQDRSSYLDVPLVLALVLLAGTLVFARFFGRAL